MSAAISICSGSDALRPLPTAGSAGPSRKGVVPIEPVLRASIKFFGRHQGGLIRDGVLLMMQGSSGSTRRQKRRPGQETDALAQPVRLFAAPRPRRSRCPSAPHRRGMS